MLKANRSDFLIKPFLKRNNIRALEISNLNSSAQIDNYLLKTINYAKVVVLRLFGDKGTWNYGIEQLLNWQAVNKKRKLVILSGTIDQEISLCEISSIDKNIALNISRLLRSGGLDNYRIFLNCLNYLVVDEKLIPDKFLKITFYADPYLHDWNNDKGEKIGIISYKSLFLANEIEVNEKLNLQLRKCGLSPKTFFISTLKDQIIQKKLIDIFKEEDIKMLAMSIQSLIHLLAIGGINLPIHHCCKTGEPIIPPLGNWEWNCYYLPSEGFSSMEDPQSNLKINASEVALLQRLLFPELPIKSNGELLGPKKVWLKILFIIETWISTQLEKDLSSLKMLREIYS